MRAAAQFVIELTALLGVLVILLRELRLTRAAMNGMKDELMREVSQRSFKAGVKSEQEAEARLAERRKDEANQ